MIRRKLFWLPSASVLRRKNTSSYSISYLPCSPVCSELGEVHGWRGCSSGAAVDSANLVPQSANKRKRVSKKERRAMVIAFVNKYREMNAGKFPTVSAARKQVGGSYYVARRIIQELEHNSKFTPINEMFENSSVQSRADENKLFSELLEDSGSQVPINTSSADSLVSNSNLPAEDFANILHKETDKDLVEYQLTLNTAVKQIMTYGDKVLADDVSGNEMSVVDEVQKDSAVTDGAVGNHVSNDGKLKIDGEYEELQADKMRTDDAVTRDFISGSEFVAMDVSSSQNVEAVKLDGDSNELARDHLGSAENDKYSQEKVFLRESILNEDDSKFRARPNPSCKMKSETPCMSEKGEIDENEETEKKSSISAAKSTIDSESPDVRGITSDRSVQKTDNHEPKKSSIWGNLKSIADNVIGIWKRLK